MVDYIQTAVDGPVRPPRSSGRDGGVPAYRAGVDERRLGVLSGLARLRAVGTVPALLPAAGARRRAGDRGPPGALVAGVRRPAADRPPALVAGARRWSADRRAAAGARPARRCSSRSTGWSSSTASTPGRSSRPRSGYFINPLVSVLLGVVVFSERLRPLQWAAVGIAAVAVAVLTVDYGRPPWIALALAASFGLYGADEEAGAGGGRARAVRRDGAGGRAGRRRPRRAARRTGTGTFGNAGTGHALLLVSSGIATADPAAAVRRGRPARSRCRRSACCST